METYHQAAFIAKRDAKIKQIKQDAQSLNSLATEINGKVHQQDKKLDDINKELEYNVEELAKANKDLEIAATVSGKSNKKLCWMLVCIAIVVAAVGITVLLAMK